MKNLSFKHVLLIISCFSFLTLILYRVSAQNQTSSIPTANETISIDNIGQLEIITTYDNDVKQIEYSPDGSLIAIAEQSSGFNFIVRVILLSSNQQITTIQGRMDSFRYFEWSPNSERIAVVSERLTGGGTLNRWVKTYTVGVDLYNSGNSDAFFREQISIVDNSNEAVSVSWSPNADLIAVAFTDRIDIYAPDRNESILTRSLTDVAEISWASNGFSLITKYSGGIALWAISQN